MTDPDDTFGDEALAAEYVLHLLDADERRSFEARLSRDQDLRALVHRWEALLAQLGEDVPDIAPPQRVKTAVLDAVGPPRKTGRRFLPGWPALLGGLAVAGLAAIVLLTNVLGVGRDLEPAFRAELSSEDQSVVLVASVIPATHEIIVEPVAGTPPAGRVFELWLIAEGATAPVSLGVLESDGPTRIRVPDEIAPGVRTGTVAVSDEPPGGSPTGVPTGSVLATATFEDL
ncbi:anti-sigma-K factor RskA [Rhodovulum iodosum]|uniref:Regulator of SigK n=1 Tax=Rhodovulum iodosum TaxID=68291 RepID=A0ABV3XWP6_9RHOB|nr:anti-sigma factor [Rhodovulum robiginosum]RSK32180.1 hypothetical protein EJA01_13245 [Rhodovulum robiginosum]